MGTVRADSVASSASSAQGRVALYLLDTKLVRPYKRRQTGREVVVYTPPGYDDPANAARRYPVLYLLHGSPGNPWNFIKIGHWDRLLDQMAAAEAGTGR